MKNSYTKIILKNNIRIYLSNVKDIVHNIINYHKYPPFPTLILANAICVLSPLKFLYNSNKMMVRIKSNGAIKSIILETNNENIRALLLNSNIITEYDNKNYNDIPLILGMGDEGLFEVSREVNNEIFKSETPLVKFDLVTDLAYHLNKSDQIYSAVVSDVKLSKINHLILDEAKSIIFQLLPNHNEDDKKWIENFLSKNKFKKNTIEQIENLIDGDLLNIFYFNSKCWCSKQKIINALKLLSLEEKNELSKEDLEIKCEFCLKKRILNKKDYLD